MRDPYFPAFLFKTCNACGKEIEDPENGGYVGQLPKGGGFTSTNIFCSRECAEGSEVLAALEHTDDQGNPLDPDDEDNYWDYEDDEEEDDDDDGEDTAEETEAQSA